MIDINKAIMKNLEEFYVTVELIFIVSIVLISNTISKYKGEVLLLHKCVMCAYFIHVIIQFIIMVININNKNPIKPKFGVAVIDIVFVSILIYINKHYIMGLMPIIYISLMFQSIRFPNVNCTIFPNIISGIYVLIKYSIDKHIFLNLQTITSIIYIYISGITLNLISKYVFKLSTQINFMFKELKEKNLELEKLASKDYLTNMYNHRSFYSSLINTIKNPSDNSTFSMAMFDIDDFKKVNDTYGHLVGDFILKEVSRLILESINNEDIASRYGGEEFAILFINKELKDAVKVCENIRNKIQNYKFEIKGCNINITISCGVSSIKINNKDVCDHCKFVDKVDKLLYKAKSAGKNCVEFSEYAEKI